VSLNTARLSDMLNPEAGPLTGKLTVPGAGPIEPIVMPLIIPVCMQLNPEAEKVIVKVSAVGFGPKPVSVTVIYKGSRLPWFSKYGILTLTQLLLAVPTYGWEVHTTPAGNDQWGSAPLKTV